MKFYAEKIKGVYTEYAADKKASYIASLPDGKYEIEIKKYAPKRSLEQNRTYWMYINILCDEFGYRKDEQDIMHQHLGRLFLKRFKVDEKTGLEIEYTESTTKLSKAQFVEYINQIQIWASMEHGIILPDPLKQEQFKVKI